VSTNPFETAEAWDVDSLLPAGDHVATIRSVKADGTSSGGHPQLELTVGNALGSIRDWIVVIDSTLGKVVQLVRAAGVRTPGDDDFHKEATGYRLHDDYANLLVDKEVVVVVREEPDYQDPSKTRTRVQGYLPVDRIGSETTPSNAFAAFESGGDAKAADSDNDIPFVHDGFPSWDDRREHSNR